MYCGTLRIAVQGRLLLSWCISGLVFAQDVTEGQVTMTTNASTEVPNNASQSTVLSDTSKFPHFDTGGLSMFLKGEPSPLSLGLVKLDRNLTFEFWFKADAYNAAGYSRDFAFLTSSERTRVNGRFESVNFLEQRNGVLAVRGRKGVYFTNIHLGLDAQHVAVVVEPGEDCNAYDVLYDREHEFNYTDAYSMEQFGMTFMRNILGNNVHLTRVTVYINGTVGDVLHINEFLLDMYQCRSFRLLRHLSADWILDVEQEWVFGAMRKEEETLGSYIMPASGYVDNLRIYNVTRTQTEIQASMFGAGVIWEDITVNESAWLTQQQYAQALDDWQGSYLQVFLPQLSEEATQSILVGWPKAWTAAQRRKTGLIQSFDFNEDPYMLAASPKYTNLVNASPSQYNPDSMSSETSPFPLRGKLIYASVIVNTVLELDLFGNLEDVDTPKWYLMMNVLNDKGYSEPENLTGLFQIDGVEYSFIPCAIPGDSLVKPGAVKYLASHRRSFDLPQSPIEVITDWTPDGISVTQTGDSVMLVHCYHDDFADCDFDPPIEREEYLTLSIAIEAGQRPKIDAARAIMNTNANHYLQVFGADDVIPNEMTIQLFHKPFQHADGSIFARLMRLNGTNLPLSLSYRRSKIVLQVGGYELSRDMQLQATNVQAGIDPGYFYEACLLTLTTTLTAASDLRYEVIYVSTLDGNATTVMSEIAPLSHILAGQGYDGSNFETLGHSVYFGSGFMANSEGQLTPYRIYYGLMDDVKIWNRVLTLEEIKASRGIRESNNSPGLLAYVTFDQFPVGIVHNQTDNNVHFPVIYETVAGANETSSGVTGQANGHKYGLTPVAVYKNVGEYDQVQAPGISSNPASYVCDVSVDGYRDPCMDQLIQQVNNEIDVLILTIRTLPVFGTLLRRNLTELQVNDTVVLPLSDEGLALVRQAFPRFNGTHPLVEDEFFGSPLVYDAPAASGLDAFTYSVRSPTLASDFEYVIAQIQVLLPSPALTSAIASDCKDVDTMTFDQNDCIRLTFSSDVREVDMHVKSSVDQYITFSCDLGDSDYYGKWASSSLYIIFKSVDANVPVPVYEVPCSVTVSNVNTDKQMPMPNSTVAMTGNWGVAQGIDHMTAIWMGGVLGLITIGMFIFVCFNRDHQAIRCTGYAMSLHVIVGLIFLCISLCFQGVYQGNELGQFGDGQCEVFISLAFSGFYFIITALCLKSYRLHVLFNWDLKRSLKQQKIVRTLMNDISLTIMIWVGYLLFVAYFILWFTVSPITTTVMGSCHTSSNMFFYISLVLLAIGLFLVSVMSYKTRTVPVHYGEPKAIAITVVCISFGLLMWVTTSFLLTDDNNLVSTVLAACTMWIVISTLVVLFGSRIYKVIKNKETSKDTDGNDDSNDPSITDTVFLKHRRTKLRAELIALQERVLEQQQALGIELQLPDTPGAENSNMVPLTAMNTETMWNMLSPGVLNSGAGSRVVPADHSVPDSGASEHPKSEPRDTLSVPQRGPNQRAKQKKIIADPAVEASLGSSTGDSICDNPTNGEDEAAEIDTLEHTTQH